MQGELLDLLMYIPYTYLFSIWMNEAQTAISVKPGQGTRAGENLAIWILFYRLCRLLTLPIIFVFDGPDCPKVKRGVNVKTGKSHWLSLPFKKFIEVFSYFWYMVSPSYNLGFLLKYSIYLGSRRS